MTEHGKLAKLTIKEIFETAFGEKWLPLKDSAKVISSVNHVRSHNDGDLGYAFLKNISRR